MGYDVRQGDPLIFLMVSSTDHINGVTGLTPTVVIKKPSGGFITPQGTVTELGNGNYQVDGHLLDTDTKGPLLLHASATGCDPFDTTYPVVSLVSGDDDDSSDTDTVLTSEELISAARDASTITVDGQTTTERSADDIIKLDQYAQQKKMQGVTDAWGSVSYRKAISPGTSGGNLRNW